MPRQTNTETTPKPEKPKDTNGSKPIQNFKHERFAQLLARGFNIKDAWEKIGNDPNFPKNAYRLKANKKIIERVKYLLAKGAERSIVDASYVKDRLARVVELALVTEINEHGQEVLGPTGNLSAASRALELLGREQGIFKDKIELGGEVSVGNRELFARLSPEERAALKATLQAAAMRRPAPANDDAPQAQSGVVPAANKSL
jgi:hypothetical protein